MPTIGAKAPAYYLARPLATHGNPLAPVIGCPHTATNYVAEELNLLIVKPNPRVGTQYYRLQNHLF